MKNKLEWKEFIFENNTYRVNLSNLEEVECDTLITQSERVKVTKWKDCNWPINFENPQYQICVWCGFEVVSKEGNIYNCIKCNYVLEKPSKNWIVGQ